MIRLYYQVPASLLALGLDMALWHPYDIAIDVVFLIFVLWGIRAVLLQTKQTPSANALGRDPS